MKKINIYVSGSVRWAAYKKDEEYQAWIDSAIASNLWGTPGTYTVEVLDADTELEQIRQQRETVKKVVLDAHITDQENPHQVTKAQVGLGEVDNVSASSLRDRSTHTGTQLASTISDFTAAVQAVTIDASKIDGGVVSNAEFATLDGITTGVSIQSQLDGKQPSGSYITALTGDVTASGPGSAAASLSATGVIAGTYTSVTVDTKGRITSGTTTGPVSRYAYSTSTAVATTSATYASVGPLTTVSLPIGLYLFKFAGTMQSTATQSGVGVRVSPVTATMTTISAKWNIAQGVDGTSHDFEYDQLTTSTNITSASVSSANTNFAVNGFGLFRVTVAGTVAIQTRTEAAGQTATLQPDAAFVLELV